MPLELGDDAFGASFMRNAALFALVLVFVAIYIRTRSKAGNEEYTKQG